MVPPNAEQDMMTPTRFLRGVGSRRSECLAKLGLHTARDLVFFFPRDYRDLATLSDVPDLQDGVLARLEGIVRDVEFRDSGGGRSRLGVLVEKDHHFLRCVWFNQPFLARRFRQGDRVAVTGTPKARGLRWEMHHPQVEQLDAEQPAEVGLLPVYRLTDGISQHQMRSMIRQTVDRFADQVEEVFPDSMREEYHLMPIAEALRCIHDPQAADELARARFRFAYQELFTMQLALAMRRASVTQSPSPPLPCDRQIDARIARLLPFELTSGQRAVLDEITADLARPRAMNRMLQGDVGSGKTMVAAYAILVTIANRHQSAFMAPTEILARQHFETFTRLLARSRVRIGLLTGSLSQKRRRQLCEEIRDGEVDLVIGTQALVQSDVEFARLGLAVVDEGHKFGVQQRARIRRNDIEPHYLVMTATPIPRTVSMTLFGDLDVSTLRELPAGRQPVHSYIGTHDRRPSWWEFVRKKLREGRQAYVIAPLVDEKEGSVVSSVEDLYEKLCSEELDAFRVGLMHGKMSSDEKFDAMERFRRGDMQVLVATSLVEVGVDVPNASVMTIENAERFGLAQLHQLRGRVGRGKHAGFVCAFSPSDTPEARQRLEAFARTQDGFELAELDFQLRGPGDLLGTKQHGLPRFRVADLQQDTEILDKARQDARALAETNSSLDGPELAHLRRRVMMRYGQSLQLGDVG